MRMLYMCNTRIGPFYIGESKGRYYPVFEDEWLGSYDTPQQAVDDLAGGHTYSIRNGIDTATLGIADEVTEWERIGR